MTPKINRREFTVKVTTSMGFAVVLTPGSPAPNTADPSFEKQQNAVSRQWSQFISDALTAWVPDPNLQVRHLEICVSEHHAFLKNAMAIRIRADTGQKLILRGVDPTSKPCVNLMTIINVPRSAIGIPRDKFRQNFHAMLNTPGVLHWVEEGYSIMSFDMEINS